MMTHPLNPSHSENFGEKSESSLPAWALQQSSKSLSEQKVPLTLLSNIWQQINT